METLQIFIKTPSAKLIRLDLKAAQWFFRSETDSLRSSKEVHLRLYVTVCHQKGSQELRRVMG